MDEVVFIWNFVWRNLTLTLFFPSYTVELKTKIFYDAFEDFMKVFGLHVVLRNHEKIFQVFFALTRSLVNMPEILKLIIKTARNLMWTHLFSQKWWKELYYCIYLFQLFITIPYFIASLIVQQFLSSNFFSYVTT